MPKSNLGGYIKGPWWRYDKEGPDVTRRCYVIAWGNIVRPPDEKMIDTRLTKFAIRTGMGADKASKFLLCTSYGEQQHTTIIQALERQDVILTGGTWTERIVGTKNGKKKVYEMRVGFIFPLGLLNLLLDIQRADSRIGGMGIARFLIALYRDPEIRKIAERNDELEEAPDDLDGF